VQGIELKPALERLYGRVPSQFEIIKLKGDASTRSYYRLRIVDGRADGLAHRPSSLIVMHLPQDYLRSDEIVNGPTPTELPFVNVHRFLEKRGIPVPKMLAEDVSRRLLLLEDLGDETLRERLQARDPQSWPFIYRQAIELLLQIHSSCCSPEPGCIAFERKFDGELLRLELDHFRQWGLEALFGPLQERDRIELEASFSYITDTIEGLPSGFVHRDFQSRNLMYAPRTSSDSLVVIDFQDALTGPRPYDLASLLCDSYVDLDPALQESLIAYYLSLAGLSSLESERFRRGFWFVVLQRKLKDAGRFIYIDRVRSNPAFLRSYPASLRYVARALEKVDGLDNLRKLLQRLIPGFPGLVSEPAAMRRSR
jgi:aminoglycoside/choline kinase family phosphotransferase